MLTIRRWCNIATLAALLVTLAVISHPAQAQLDGDPAMIPQPELFPVDHDRAVVVSVIFNSDTDVIEDGVIISNARAPGSLGNPPLILLELLDANDNVIASQFDWHPLWTREWDDEGSESGPVDDSGTGTFYVPFDPNLAAVRISDVKLDMELMTVDVSVPVDAYCASVPVPAVCSIFMNGFE